MRLRSIRFNHAFTLIEIMMAMAIFMLVLSAIYATWYGIVRGAKIGQQAAAQAQRERAALRIVEEALSAVQSFQGSIDYYGFEVENGSDAHLSFAAKLPPSFPRSGRFHGLDVRRVTFSLEQGEGFDKELVMRQQPIIRDMDRDEEEHPMVLAKHMKKLEFKFFDERKQTWVEDWPQTNQIPQLMMVTLGFVRPGHARGWDDEREVTRLITPVTIAVPVAWQTPQRGGQARPGAAPGGIPGGLPPGGGNRFQPPGR